MIPVMQIREVRVPVPQRRMRVRMDVRLAAVPGEVVHVLMVLVVHVRVRMADWCMRMQMTVPLGKMQPYAGGG